MLSHRSRTKRGVPAEELADVFRRYTDRPVYCKERLEDAVRTAMNERGETGEIYCLGSFVPRRNDEEVTGRRCHRCLILKKN